MTQNNFTPNTVTSIHTQSIACGEPRLVRAVMPFAGVDEWIISLQNLEENDNFDGAQAMYFDASELTNRAVLIVQTTSQRIILTERTQGYLPLLVPSPGIFSFGNDGQGDIGKLIVHFINVPVPAAVWNAAP
jgi:hypothetical protein